MTNTEKSIKPSFYNRLVEFHLDSMTMHKGWIENVKKHLEKNVHRDPSIRSEDYFVHLCDCIENWMENKLDLDVEQFEMLKGAAGVCSPLSHDESLFIENNIGPLTKENIGYYVLFELATETAENIAFGKTVSPLLN